MHTIVNPDTPPLREALYALAMAKHIPDAQTLDKIVCQYPQFGDELTDFAVELVLDALRKAVPDTVNAAADRSNAVSPVVSRAISRFHNRLYMVRQGTYAKQEHRTLPKASFDNPFAALSRTDFRAVANRIGANTVLVAKLRDRQIEPDTIPKGFMRCVADALEIPSDLLVAHLEAAGSTAGSSRQFYKAEGKPSGGKRQTFEDAVKSSGLTDETQRRLLSY